MKDVEKRLEHPDGRSVDLRIGRKREYRFFERQGDAAEFEHEDCRGLAPEVEGEFMDRVETLLAEGFVVIDNPFPALEVLDTLEKYTHFVVRSQELGMDHSLAEKDMRQMLKTELGFKTLKAMNAETDAWNEYLWGDPEKARYVDEKHMAAFERLSRTEP